MENELEDVKDTDIYGTQRLNANDISDPWTYHTVPTACQNVHLFIEIS